MSGTPETFSSQVHIRDAVPADAETLTRFNVQLAWDSEELRLDPERVRRGVEAVLAGKAEARYFVVEVDGNLAGQMMFTREWSDWRNGWLYWVQSVFVDTPYRRRGLFRQLFEYARDVAAADPECLAIRLYVEQDNQRAQDAYVRLGFQRSGYLVMEYDIRMPPSPAAT